MGPEDEGLAAEQVNAPKAILRMSKKSEPGRSTAVIFWVIVLGQDAANDVLIDVDTECGGQLFSDSTATELRMPSFHFDDGRDQFG
jgi:hypothetical protein